MTARAIGDALGLDAVETALLGVLAIAAVLEDAVGRGTTAISAQREWETSEFWGKPGRLSKEKKGTFFSSSSLVLICERSFFLFY